jgi:hypothetical protein
MSSYLIMHRYNFTFMLYTQEMKCINDQNVCSVTNQNKGGYVGIMRQRKQEIVE